ncbi:MAG: 4Fe-4S ferredoxin [Melioribacteraceae bacterium]|nr:MAG: 4Fe-4S ferredoxin [Melioribacteraceae bacterium]
MLRKIIEIDEAKCDGCGNCVPECHEGALQIIDGKARLISDLFCDGLGACIGHCPTGAMKVVEREAEPYNEKIVMETIVRGGPNVIKAHLKHLKEHEEFEYLSQAVEYLKEHNLEVPSLIKDQNESIPHSGCPGSREVSFDQTNNVESIGKTPTQLTQWPIQLHLVNPSAAYYRSSHLLLAADCAGFAYPDFHRDFLSGKSLAIACPKLDTNKQVYLDKLITMINSAGVKEITVLVMQVPCCSGLLQMATQAAEFAEMNIKINAVVIGVNGEVLKEATIQ